MDRKNSHHGTGRRRGFTLVELLVVIGIIALLISILIPALTRAKQAAEGAKCKSNMKQITTAVISFTVENKGRTPTVAGTSVMYFDPAAGKYVSLAANDANIKNPSDWIAWRRGKDPITGAPVSDIVDQNITYSALGKYMSFKPKDHTPLNYDEANNMARGLEAVFRCPGDVLESRPNADPTRGAYRYSYSMNNYYRPDKIGVRGDGHMWTGKISSIYQPAEKIMLVCEDEQTIDDGVFNANTDSWVNTATGRINAVASRHQKRAEAKSLQLMSIGNKDAMGNVGFWDGSVRTFGRKDALRQRFTGNPAADNTAF
ncbi:MAG: prepilin-type N-terminal cleavage/methylation domain-containing protein [Tepidisphaeraceae bacterium]